MTRRNTSITKRFSFSQARQIVSDCFRPNPRIYWSDFLITYAIGIFCLQRVRGGTILVPHQGYTGEPQQFLFFVVGCLAFYRVAMFIHELVHQRTEKFWMFRFAWNLLCGIPFLMPTFVYYTHIDHHRRAHYGTNHDGEYLPLVFCRRWYVLYYLSWAFLIPILAVFRFMILTPIAWVAPSIRGWVHRHASSMVMDPSYIRPLPTNKVRRVIFWQELGCFLWCWGCATVPWLLGRTTVPFVIHVYLMAVVIVTLNSVRTLGSHRWGNHGDQEMTFLDQLLDSVNYPNAPWFSELWGPVGSRFHALHHLFPSMPYHNMPRAHRLLMKNLPADSPYRETISPSLTSAIRELIHEMGRDPNPIPLRNAS